jgi:hypothetical protein
MSIINVENGIGEEAFKRKLGRKFHQLGKLEVV